MQAIIPPIERSLIEQELTPERLLRRTHRADNLIYVVDAYCAPNVMREIGRLREIAFRQAGGGTGTECDIDEFDLMRPCPCKQLLVWNPQEREIIGAYRYILGRDVEITPAGPHIATSHMFRFSQEFLEKYLPYTIELGRSWVHPAYQSSRAGVKAIFALDNLWDGLGALIVNNPEIRYFFGKVTMYPEYPTECRDALLGFLHAHFPDPDALVRPIEPLQSAYKQYTTLVGQADLTADFHSLQQFIRQHGCNIPPLVNAYISLSPTLRMLGTAINREFGDVEESGILISVDDIRPEKKSRHIMGI